jgi:hypothetical protein
MSVAKIIPYPKFQNKDFYEKIYKKKEFYDTQQKHKTNDDNFRLSSSQRFVRNYISESTPYRSLYIFHETGVGKTCAAISIAERFTKYAEETGKKIIILTEKSIRNEFYKTVFNLQKELLKKDKKLSVQCTGRKYELGPETKQLTTDQKKKIVVSMIEKNYEIIGKGAFVSHSLKSLFWNGKKDTLTDRIKNDIKDMFSDRVIIVDEAHGKTGSVSKDSEDKLYPFLKVIIENSIGIRLILMSATPMSNNVLDIYPQLELLRLNSGLETPKKTELFNIDSSVPSLKKNNVSKLRELFKGFVSYVRGGDPEIFPYTLIAEEAIIPKSKYDFSGNIIKDKNTHIKIVECYSSQYQYDIYVARLKKEAKDIESDFKIGLSTGILQAGDIIFPSPESSKRGTYGSDGYSPVKDESAFFVSTISGRTTYSYNKFSEGFLLKENIEKYSTKFYKIYNNIINSIGISFVYSQWLEGCLYPLAMMLEQNGFEPITGQRYLLNTNIKRPLICYKCGKPKHPETDHIWKSAKYLLFTGSAETMETSKITDLVNRKENKYGELVKVILGSDASSEGVDFHRIRQVHIVEPWYNLQKLDQVIGRGSRNKSHIDLPPEERNVTIFRYCIVPPKKSSSKVRYTETADEYRYRIAFQKDRYVKEVERIMKEMAVDCVFQKENNIRLQKRMVTLENSFGKKIKYQSGDLDNTRICDYKKCNYKCEWEPKMMKIEIDKTTYGKEFIVDDIENVRYEIYDMFRKNFVIDFETIKNNIQEKYKDIEELYIYIALTNFLDKQTGYILQDKYGREGYLVEKDNYYIFQPNELSDKKAPVLYKSIPIKTKEVDVPFDMFDIKFEDIQEKTKKVREDIIKKVYDSYNYNKNRFNIYINNIEKYDDIINEITFTKFSDKEIVSLLTNIIDKNFDKEYKKFAKIVFDFYNKKGNIYITDKVKLVSVGPECSQYKRSHKGLKKEKSWGHCDNDILTSVQTEIRRKNYEQLFKNIKKEDVFREDIEFDTRKYIEIIHKNNVLSDYIGSVEYSGKNDKIKFLKIWNFKNYVKKDSKRTERRGITCYTVEGKELFNIYNFLNNQVLKNSFKDFKETNKKIKKNDACILIEFMLRYLNKKTDKIWFMDIGYVL